MQGADRLAARRPFAWAERGSSTSTSGAARDQGRRFRTSRVLGRPLRGEALVRRTVNHAADLRVSNDDANGRVRGGSASGREVPLADRLDAWMENMPFSRVPSQPSE
jgi:hypothetical protein